RRALKPWRIRRAKSAQTVKERIKEYKFPVTTAKLTFVSLVTGAIKTKPSITSGYVTAVTHLHAEFAM
ncbi:unnamed protein product, partial [Heterosigma akashiwo]